MLVLASVEQVGHFCDGLVWFLVVLVVGGFFGSSFCFGSGMCSLFDFYMVMGCSSLSLSLSYKGNHGLRHCRNE